jgi:hypothetical protein
MRICHDCNAIMVLHSAIFLIKRRENRLELESFSNHNRHLHSTINIQTNEMINACRLQVFKAANKQWMRAVYEFGTAWQRYITHCSKISDNRW